MDGNNILEARWVALVEAKARYVADIGKVLRLHQLDVAGTDAVVFHLQQAKSGIGQRHDATVPWTGAERREGGGDTHHHVAVLAAQPHLPHGNGATGHRTGRKQYATRTQRLQDGVLADLVTPKQEAGQDSAVGAAGDRIGVTASGDCTCAGSGPGQCKV